MIRGLLILLSLALPLAAGAAFEAYEFRDDETRERYQRFIDDLRCPKCQNQNLSGSNAPIAQDLRQALYQQLEQGRSDEEIVDFMVSRYGDYILYKPPLEARTVLLWASPVLLLAIGLGMVLRNRSRRPTAAVAGDADLSPGERERLQRLLGD
jgi:cytochrome c-type biogenesis protein CcmH